jgi:tRNA (mo5U34)-methyltransferase
MVVTEDIRARVEQVDWWHTIDLGEGLVTPGRDRSAEKLARMHLPADLSGRTVLDIGAWDGFFSFECERRGAERVLAADLYAWEGAEGGDTGFEVARSALGSRVESVRIDAMELSPDTVGVFDIVLHLGVLYHMKHPLLALERVASVTGDQLILETHVDFVNVRRPCMAIYPGGEAKQDATNWCGPNPAAVEAMLRMAGFRRTKIVWRDSSARRVGRAVRWKLENKSNAFWPMCRYGRVVVHAWK